MEKTASANMPSVAAMVIQRKRTQWINVQRHARIMRPPPSLWCFVMFSERIVSPISGAKITATNQEITKARPTTASREKEDSPAPILAKAVLFGLGRGASNLLKNTLGAGGSAGGAGSGDQPLTGKAGGER